MISKEFLKTIYVSTWMVDCVDYLPAEFFDMSPDVAIKPRSIFEQIADEKFYRKQRMKLSPANESHKIYLETTLELSRERERKLQTKLDRMNGPDDISRAREYPIDELIQFKHGFANCPWHKELKPSLHLIPKTNVAYCFGCARSYDSIDVAMLLFGLSFINAVKKLAGK